ncbi:heme exporter protein CcmD [Acidisoma sp. 7E03]
MTNLPYILAAYAVVVVSCLALSGQAWARHRTARRRLAALEADSPRRRMGRPA